MGTYMVTIYYAGGSYTAKVEAPSPQGAITVVKGRQKKFKTARQCEVVEVKDDKGPDVGFSEKPT